MIALDLNLEGAINRLGELKDGKQEEFSPKTGFGGKLLDVMQRQFEAVQLGKANLDGQIRAAVEEFQQGPLFQWVLSQIPPLQMQGLEMWCWKLF